MIILDRREFQTGPYIIRLQKWIILKYLLPTRPVCQQFQYIFHAQSISAHTRTPATLARLEGDA